MPTESCEVAMKITYLNHSGFLLEWEHCYWIFDYYQGQIPRLDENKTIIVFCSHSHGDHFNPAVFALAQSYPAVKYVFSTQVRPAYRKFDRNVHGIRVSETQYEQVCGKRPEFAGGSAVLPLPEVEFLTSRTECELDDGHGGALNIFTLRSTDCGCAFLVSYEGRTIYHAGDLHWWIWPGEPEKDNRHMTGNFKKEMEYLEGRCLDAAFAPLDARLEENYGLGLSYLLEHADVRHVFPMHFWNDFSVMDAYAADYPLPEGTVFHKISGDGQSWEIE